MNKFSFLAASAAFILFACGETPTADSSADASNAQNEEVTPPVAALVDGDYTLNPDASEIVWVGTKVTGEHKGNIRLADGTLRVTEGRINGGTITIDMTSITNTDLDAENGANLVGHLASDDFFGVENFPTATFKFQEFAPTASGGILQGELTIKGITQANGAEVTVNAIEGGIEIRGVMKIDRTEFGIRYGSGTFFEDIGDKAISDFFELGFFIVANS